VLAEARSSATLALYDEETDAARRLGIFGSPSFVAEGEVFWGDDRLEEALDWARGSHPAQRR
jgi:2-hydroxychromene-2-carboxylate isomerase